MIEKIIVCETYKAGRQLMKSFEVEIRCYKDVWRFQRIFFPMVRAL